MCVCVCVCLFFVVNQKKRRIPPTKQFVNYLTNIARLLFFRTSYSPYSTRPAKPRLRINSEDFVSGDDNGQTNSNQSNVATENVQLDQDTPLRTDADDQSVD